MFKIISHTADVGIDVSGSSLEELFIEAAHGWKRCVIEDSPTKSVDERKVKLSAASLEDLMVQWLNELNFFLTVRRWILHTVVKAKIIVKGSACELNFLINGEPVDYQVQEISMDIKSVTYHQLQIRKTDNRYKTRIIFDI